MKSKVLLFSTRDIGINGTLFEHANPQICKELCNFFIKVNLKELNELKSNIVQSLSNNPTVAPELSIDEVCEKISHFYGGDLPSEITEVYSDGLDAIIAATENILKDRPNNDLTEFLLAVKGGEPIVPPFTLNDFNNIELLNSPAVNIEKSGKTLEERVSIYSSREIIDKDVRYQVFAVWSLGEGVSDNSWEEALVKSVIEQIQNEPAEQKIDELEIYLFLHDKDLERTYNKPFKTEYVKRSFDEDEAIKVSYTFTSFTHADYEYTQIKGEKDTSLPMLFSKIETQTNDNVIFQKLLELSDQLSNWHKENQKDTFASDLIDFVSESEWNGERWRDLHKSVDQIRSWSNLPDEEKRRILMELNNKINKEIKQLRNRVKT